MKTVLKNKAIQLRQEGLSYSEILKEIHISKSILSLWIRSISLTDAQKERLKIKRKNGSIKASYKNRKIRIDKTNYIKKQSRQSIQSIDTYNLLLMGTMLYWAEGAKQKENNVSQGVCFSNSDPYMVKLFLLWLKNCLHVADDAIFFDIYIHETYKIPEKIKLVVMYWSTVTGFSTDKFDRIYYKKSKIFSNRKNRNYFGLLRINIKKSTDLNRKIAGWIEGICHQCGIV